MDILVNNAAQTIHRPPSAYVVLVEGERQPLPGVTAPPDAGSPDTSEPLPATALDMGLFDFGDLPS